MKRKTAIKLRNEFDDAEEEFGQDKSTEFLLAVTGDRNNVESHIVADALYYCHIHNIPTTEGRLQ